jgi:OmpA-OmpF porin, OOP family
VAAFTDFRGRSDYTAEDLANALFAMDPAKRGIGPKELTGPSVIPKVLFVPGSSEIRPESYPDLDKLGQVLSSPQFREHRILIEGHTDSIGSEHYNQRLSARRAESVRHYLVNKFAIAPERLIAKGYGASNPIADNSTPEGRERNRRVEIVNLG